MVKFIRVIYFRNGILGIAIVSAVLIMYLHNGSSPSFSFSTKDHTGAAASAPKQKKPAKQLQSLAIKPVLSKPDVPVLDSSLTQLPVLPDTSDIISNTGPFVDADSNVSIVPSSNTDQTLQNAGVFIDADDPLAINQHSDQTQ